MCTQILGISISILWVDSLLVEIPWNNAEIYEIIFVLSYQYLPTGGGVNLEFLFSFLIAVLGGVACRYIIK